MLPTSQRYKDAVAYRGEFTAYARRFSPVAGIEAIDINAHAAITEYTATSEAFYSRLSDIYDRIETAPYVYGSLEDFQFLLSSNVRLMPNTVEEIQTVQVGYVSEALSGADGVFETPVVLTCYYSRQITTAGRTLMFNPHYDAVPKDILIEYIRAGTLVATETITNAEYILVGQQGVTNYDTVRYTFSSTSIPYRRIHLIEDLPGIYLTFDETQITSVSLSQEIDVLSETILISEIELAVQNVTKFLNILNKSGLEQYLAVRQPATVSLTMVFPDDSREEILIGNWTLSSWKSNKGTLEASFIITDPLDALTQDTYIKGIIPETPASMYELAETVFIDAEVEKYIIDEALHNVYTDAPLPVATHLELLRLIAQASQSVVIPRVDGTVEIKYISPLKYAANEIKDGDFSEEDKWTLANSSYSTDYVYEGNNSVKLLGPTTSSLTQQVAILSEHKYYFRLYAYIEDDIRADANNGDALLLLAGIQYILINSFRDANIPRNQWTLLSNIVTMTESGSADLLIQSLISKAVYIDGVMLLDLTTIYGEGNEPTAEWCDQNIRFFPATTVIPRATDPVADDHLDYSVMESSPEVALPTSAVKAVETMIYSFAAEDSASEVYSGIRLINGTDEFDIDYSSIAKDCTFTAGPVDENGEYIAGSATVLISELYAQAAHFKIRASGNIKIVIKGIKLTRSSATYKIAHDKLPSLQATGDTYNVDNSLITYKTVAEDVTAYAAYWKGSRYTYNFDWRQDPAQQLLDVVTVHDDFDVDNPILITTRDISYVDGVLSGSSGGVY